MSARRRGARRGDLPAVECTRLPERAAPKPVGAARTPAPAAPRSDPRPGLETGSVGTEIEPLLRVVNATHTDFSITIRLLLDVKLDPSGKAN